MFSFTYRNFFFQKIIPARKKNNRVYVGHMIGTERCEIVSTGFIKFLNRRATEFDTRAKNWHGPEGGPGACSPIKF